MINIIKKITVAFLALFVVAGVVAPTASALAATFNNDSRDYATLQVSNYTRNPGSNSNWTNSVSANAGEVVSFLVYYHNTASDTANNTRIRVQLPSGSFTSTSIQGEVWASNGSVVTGSASVNLTSGQTLTFIPGSVAWYPNQSSVAQSLPNGQNGSEIVSANGVTIGDIAGGWDAQGYIVFRAQVSSTTVNPPQQPTGSAPIVSTNSASYVYQDRATVQGTANPNNSATVGWFEYGTTQSFGNTTGYQTIGSGNGNSSMSGYLYNLNQNTTYYYRAVAQNSYGTTYGNTLSFTTQGASVVTGSAPYVTTHSAASIAQNSATLQGAVNPNNSVTNAWFEYGTTQSFGNTTGYQSVGSVSGSSNISGYLSNLTANTTYYYRAVAQNSYGTTYGNTLSFTTQQSNNGGVSGTVPSVYTTAATALGANSVTMNGSVNPNNNYTNAWFEYGLTQSLGYTVGYQSIGSANYSSNISANVSNLAANTTYYYRAVAQNSYGTSYGTIMSFTTSGSSNSSGNAPYVTSHVAQSIFRNSALINGSVNPNGSLSTAWFDWGTTAALGNRTMVQPVGMATYASNYSAVLSGLQAGTTYYYRAVAQNAYGTTYGTILNFTTAANAIVPVVVNNTTTEPRVIIQQISGSATAVPTVILTPSIDNDAPRAGETVKYSIQYRNEGSKAITGATMKVVLPSEVEYDSATLKPSISNDNELTFDLGTIKANSQGVITIKVTIANDVEADSALMFSATLNYTDAKKQFQSTSAYLTVMVKDGTAGLASLISVFGDLLNNWFVDLVLGLLIGFGIYHFFVRQKEEEVLIK